MSLDVSLVTRDVDGNEYTAYDGNITHNLNKMAEAASIYYAMWRPDECGRIYARDIIDTLEAGLYRLKREPQFFKQYDSPNGWGLYEHFVPFVEEYLEACKRYPSARIDVSR